MSHGQSYQDIEEETLQAAFKESMESLPFEEQLQAAFKESMESLPFEEQLRLAIQDSLCTPSQPKPASHTLMAASHTLMAASHTSIASKPASYAATISVDNEEPSAPSLS